MNNDFGLNMTRGFSAAYTALGGVIISTTPCNENQPSYGAEVTAAMTAESEGVFAVKASLK